VSLTAEEGFLCRFVRETRKPLSHTQLKGEEGKSVKEIQRRDDGKQNSFNQLIKGKYPTQTKQLEEKVGQLPEPRRKKKVHAQPSKKRPTRTKLN